MSSLLAEFGTGEVFWSFLWFVMFFIWIWLLIIVFSDIFRQSRSLGMGQGDLDHLRHPGALPRGAPPTSSPAATRCRSTPWSRAKARTPPFRRPCRVPTPAPSTADELAKLADLKAKGAISDAEYEQLKAKALA